MARKNAKGPAKRKSKFWLMRMHQIKKNCTFLRLISAFKVGNHFFVNLESLQPKKRFNGKNGIFEKIRGRKARGI